MLYPLAHTNSDVSIIFNEVKMFLKEAFDQISSLLPCGWLWLLLLALICFGLFMVTTISDPKIGNLNSPN